MPLIDYYCSEVLYEIYITFMYSYIPNYHQSTVQTAHLNVKLKSHIAFDNAAEALGK